jgi:hypothetical protein
MLFYFDDGTDRDVPTPFPAAILQCGGRGRHALLIGLRDPCDPQDSSSIVAMEPGVPTSRSLRAPSPALAQAELVWAKI